MENKRRLNMGKRSKGNKYKDMVDFVNNQFLIQYLGI